VKPAAFGLERAVAFRGIRLQFGIDLPDSGYGLLGIAPRIGSFMGIAFAHLEENYEG
jgi:hypothetical protein